MRSIRQMTQKMLLVIGFGLGLGFVAATASASPTMPQNGVEYTVLDRPQPAEGGKKVEVIEFFGYFCPHCNALEPVIAAWVKSKVTILSLNVSMSTFATWSRSKNCITP